MEEVQKFSKTLGRTSSTQPQRTGEEQQISQ